MNDLSIQWQKLKKEKQSKPKERRKNNKRKKKEGIGGKIRLWNRPMAILWIRRTIPPLQIPFSLSRI